MKVLFATTRGTGHFSPLVPYAREISRRGHDVAFAARDDLADKIAALGFEHFVLGAPDQQALEAIWARTKGLPEEEVLEIYVKETFGGVTARAAMPAMRNAISTWKPDLVVRETVEFSSIVTAEEAGVPLARVEVHAAHGEEKYSGIALSALDLLREGIGLAADNGRSFEAEPAFSSFPKSLDGMIARRGRPTFRVGPPDVDPPATASEPSWKPQDDRPLIYMTFGTETQNFDHAKSIYQTALAAVAGLPVNILLTTGKPMDADVLGPVPANVTVMSFVPQNEVFCPAKRGLSTGNGDAPPRWIGNSAWRACRGPSDGHHAAFCGSAHQRQSGRGSGRRTGGA